MSTYRTKGIVLYKKDFREYDGLFVIYTENLGKIQVMARGVKKIRSKMSAHLEPFLITDLMIAKGRGFGQIAGSSAIANLFKNQKNKSLVKNLLGIYCLELVDELTKFDYQDKEVFKLLNEVLKIIDKDFSEDKKDKFVVLVNIFGFKLLVLLGYGPELYNCLVCKKKIIPNGNFFDYLKGGLVCGSCSKKSFSNDRLFIDKDIIKVLRLMSEKDLIEFLKLKVDKNKLTKLNNILYNYIRGNIEIELKTSAWLKI